MKATKVKKYRIWSYEHNAWWNPNWNGYTTVKARAGIYGEDEAKRICADANLFGKINEEMREVEEKTECIDGRPHWWHGSVFGMGVECWKCKKTSRWRTVLNHMACGWAWK